MDKKVISNYLYNLVYQILAIALPVFTIPYVSRILGANGIGEYNYINGVVTYFGIFAALGTVTYAQKEIACVQDNLYKRSKKFWEIFYIRLICSFIILMIYLIFTFIFLQKYRLLLIVNLFMVFSWPIDVSWFFQGVENFKVTAIRNSIVKIIATLSVFIFVKNEYDVWIYCFIYAFANFVGNLTMIPYLKIQISYVKIKFKDMSQDIRGILELFFPVIAVQLYTVLNKIMLGAMSSTLQVGYFSQGNQVITMAITVISSLATVLIPRVALLFKDNNLKEVRMYIELAISNVFLLGMPMMIGCFMLSQYFVPAFFGKGYEPVINIMYILSPMFIILGLGSLLGSILIAINRQKQYTFAVSIAAICNLLLNFIFIKAGYGAEGVAIATLASELVSTIIQMIYLRDLTHMLIYIKPFLKYMCISFVIVIIAIIAKTFVKNSLVLLVLVILFSIIGYFSCLFIFKDPIFIQEATPFISKLGKKK